MGFGVPLTQWLSGQLSKLLDDILLDSNAMEPLSMRVVVMELEKFRSFGQNASRIWTLLMYGLWRVNATINLVIAIINHFPMPNSILMICPVFRPFIGGSERAAERLSLKLVQRDIKLQ